MNEDSYQVKQSQQIYQYEFFSEGPKGRIRKVIQLQTIADYNKLFNLAFGDWDEERKTINDMVKSNNSDKQKILVTVAQTVFQFMKEHLEFFQYLNKYRYICDIAYNHGLARLYRFGQKHFDW